MWKAGTQEAELAASNNTRAKMKLVTCTFAEHGAAILAIFNDAIANSTALYEYEPRTLAFMETWFLTKAASNFPVIGAIDEADSTLLGFASYGSFRTFPAYKYSVEHSVYTRADGRRRGIGRFLLTEILAAAEKQGYHTIIGAIDSTNEASIRLHESLGFEKCGHIRDVGFKFGRWLDAVFYQRILPTPATPRDGNP